MRARSRRPLPAGFGTVWSSVAVDLVGFGIVLPILPIYARRFHASPLEAALLVSAFSAAGFVCSPLWGRLSDRIGRRPVILIALAGTAVGSLLTGLAGGLPLLFAGRLVDGGSGASVSVAQAAAADLSPPEERTRLLGLLGAAFGVGFVAGPAIGALGALAGPRAPFLLAAGIAGVNALVAAVRLPETRAPAGADQGPAPPATAGGGPEGRPAAGVAALVAVAFAAMVAFSGFEATFALFGQRHLGFGIGSAAAVFTGVGAVIVVVQAGVVRPVVARLGESRTLLAGLAANAAGLLLLAASTSWTLAAPALLALTVGQGLVQTTMASALVGLSSPARRGQVLGAQQSASSLARVVGPAAGGALLGSQVGGDPYLLGAAMTALALVGVVVSIYRSSPSGYITER
jgi:DHA1 family tetracycline resistance protein-like MFS transporter